MIKVIRNPEPEGFSNAATQWQHRFEEAKRNTPNLTASKFWNKIRREIRPYAKNLFDVFQGKCAYCEAKMTHVSVPHIEHYHPKSNLTYQHLMFDWNNWLLSCGRCNEKKWLHFPQCREQPCLLNPCEDEPNQHLNFLDSQIIPITERGKQTIRLVGLDRYPLVEERTLWLLRIKQLILLCLLPVAKQEARNLLLWSMQPEAPFCATTRAYLKAKTPKLANPETAYPQINIEDPVRRIDELIQTYQNEIMELE